MRFASYGLRFLEFVYGTTRLEVKMKIGSAFYVLFLSVTSNTAICVEQLPNNVVGHVVERNKENKKVDSAITEEVSIPVIWNHKEYFEANPVTILETACNGLSHKYKGTTNWCSGTDSNISGYKLTLLSQPRYATAWSVTNGKVAIWPNKLPYSDAKLMAAPDKIQDSFKVLVEAPDGKKAIVTVRLKFDFNLQEGAIPSDENSITLNGFDSSIIDANTSYLASVARSGGKAIAPSAVCRDPNSVERNIMVAFAALRNLFLL